eukprot:scaffold65064_cov68-Phaeocystis_antarctica.AAC.9
METLRRAVVEHAAVRGKGEGNSCSSSSAPASTSSRKIGSGKIAERAVYLPHCLCGLLAIGGRPYADTGSGGAGGEGGRGASRGVSVHIGAAGEGIWRQSHPQFGRRRLKLPPSGRRWLVLLCHPVVAFGDRNPRVADVKGLALKVDGPIDAGYLAESEPAHRAVR